MKRTAMLLCSAWLAVGAAMAKDGRDMAAQRVLPKDWAFSRCLARGYPAGPARDDAAATASAYLEAGRQPVDAYEALERAADAYLRRDYDGSVHADFTTMKCIEFYRSAALDRLATRLAASRPR